MKDKIRCSKRKQSEICFDCGDNTCRLNYYYDGTYRIKKAVYEISKKDALNLEANNE